MKYLIYIYIYIYISDESRFFPNNYLILPTYVYFVNLKKYLNNALILHSSWQLFQSLLVAIAYLTLYQLLYLFP